MLLRSLLIFAFCLAPVWAEEPNVVAEAEGSHGAAARLVLAERTYRKAIDLDDPVLLLAAIHLARGVVTRPATAWQKTTSGPDEAPEADAEAQAALVDLAGPAAIEVLQGLAVDDPNLQELVSDLDAQVPAGRLPVATIAAASISGGAIDAWTLPLSGAVPAELGLIGDGSTRLDLRITDETGAVLCAMPAVADAALCRFTPARNGFFTVQVSNGGSLWNRYRLVGN